MLKYFNLVTSIFHIRYKFSIQCTVKHVSKIKVFLPKFMWLEWRLLTAR